MKVLIANDVCRLGGVSTFMLSLQSGLRRLGHTCDLFFFEHGPGETLLPSDGSVYFGNLGECLEHVRRNRVDIVHGCQRSTVQ